jgi:hypothetical protein
VSAVRDFEELRIRVRRIGAERYLVLANGMSHGVRATRVGDAAVTLREELNRLIAVETGQAPAGSTNTSTSLRQLGQSVFDVLLDDALIACVRQARADADRHGRGLRLRFDLPPALHALPVEALCSPSAHPEQTFALDGNLSIVRSLPGDLSGHRLPAGDDEPDLLHLLVAIAAPDDLPPIDADAELAELRELPDFVVHTDVIRNATRANIEKWLSANADRPTAVLLIAHGRQAANGDDGVILLEAKDGTADPVPGHLLSGMFVRAQRLRLVVLNLCFSAWNSAREPFAGLAQAMIGRGIPAVVAMHGLVTDRAAGVFGPKLLAGVCANSPVDEAMTSARHHMADLPGHTAIEWATPMLFLHAACGHGWLFKAREVREDDEWTDPLRAGDEALRQLGASGNIKPATAFAAARFLRLRHEWRRMESIAKATGPTAERTQLITEARLELAWPAVERLCAALADADHVLARRHLDEVRDQLPDDVLRLLTGEITAADAVDGQLDQARKAAAEADWQTAVDRYERIERDQPPGARDVTAELVAARQEVALAEHYTCLHTHHRAGRWQAALDEGAAILAVREGGYRDTATWVGYLTGRVAEAAARWTDAAGGYALCHGFADAPARLAHAHGHVAAGHGDWAAAENHFRAATELGVGETHLAGYAAGRAAEDADAWDAVLRCYADLPDTMLDIGARRRYADGMVADGRADWTGVIDRFGELPDDFAGGEVGRRRQFARAKLSEQRLDWRAVLTLLGAMRDSYRAGSAGVLRRTARGRLAEADGYWARAAECYASAGGAGELDLAHRYATGRGHELDGDWSAALETYAALPREHRDVQQRAGYATARAAEQALDWARAADLYTALPDDFADVPARSRYATLRAVVAEQKWAAAAEEAAALGDYLDAATVAAYARGRLAEQRADWAGAIGAYESCGDHADAASRATYTRARHLDAAGHWSAAKAGYEQAPSIDRDTRRRIERLDRLLAALPFLAGVAEATLVTDPVALRESTFPYLALRDAGVTPASPTEVVTDAAFTLMERGGISWQERVAWDQLRTPAKRLLLDARLYRLREPAALGQALAELDPATEPSPLDWLCARLSADSPLLILLAGDRVRATALWRRRLTDRPDDQDDVHCLGVTSFWHAQDLEETGAWEQAVQVWRIALACLAMLLTDDEFWIGWRQGRATCYRHAVTPADTRLVRIELGRYLIGVLTGHAERHANAGRPPEADRYQELVFFFEAELDAAGSLQEAGGLPLRGGDGRLSCGPGYLRLVGLAQEFGEFIAEEDRPERADTDPRQELLRRLRCAFSALSTASSLLDHRRFEPALHALPDYHRLRRPELPDDCAGPARHGGVGRCVHCREFVEHDPAYTFLPNRRFRLLRDAVGLAVRTHLSIARDMLAGRRLEPAMAELASAIGVGTNALMGARAKDAARRVVLGRVDALTEPGERGGTGLDEAIELVEKAASVLDDPALTDRLAELLVHCGVWCGSGRREFGVPIDLARAVGELRRAFALRPESTLVRHHLAQGLIHHSDERPDRDSAGRLALLIEALRAITGGLDLAGMNRSLREVLDRALESVEGVLLTELSEEDMHRFIRSIGTEPVAGLTGADKAREHAAEAGRRRESGDLTRCAHELVRAVRAVPADERYRADLLAALDDVLAERREGAEGT